mgnify:CR=1 FL=1
MNIYIHKILPLVVSPLFLFFIIIFCGIIFKSRKIIIISTLTIIIFSLPIISKKLNLYLQKDYSLKDISSVNEADAIVVLSGIVSVVKVGDKLKYEFGGGVDRILSGMDLFKKNKAPLLILTRGKLPWQYGIPEGEFLREFAVKFGIPKESILLTEEVKNTDEEAKSVKKILNIKNANVILVTSAFHMPRAQKVFEAANVNVIPFPVDFQSLKKITFIDFIPSASGLSGTSNFIREILGRLYYSLKY